MPQSFASVHLHIVFATKHRESYLTAEFAPAVHAYMTETVKSEKCVPLCIGGMPDHVHLLVGLGRETTIADLLQRVKGASSRWISDTFPALEPFAWQKGYAAFAVANDLLPTVRQYIERQGEHHRETSFQDGNPSAF